MTYKEKIVIVLPIVFSLSTYWVGGGEFTRNPILGMFLGVGIIVAVFAFLIISDD